MYVQWEGIMSKQLQACLQTVKLDFYAITLLFLYTVVTIGFTELVIYLWLSAVKVNKLSFVNVKWLEGVNMKLSFWNIRIYVQ